jgi:hypothetical protein
MSTPGDAAAVEEARRIRERSFEIVSTLILAMAALATAWTGYQASLWDGIQSSDYSRASAMRTSAAALSNDANQYRLADLLVFQGYIEAKATGDNRLANFYLARFRPELRKAYDVWITLDPLTDPAAPPSPFAMDAYVPPAQVKADQLNKQADATFAEGEKANDYSDVFTLSTVLFASALFFSAISERFEFVPARVTLLVLAGSGLIGGFVVGFSQPITSG